MVTTEVFASLQFVDGAAIRAFGGTERFKQVMADAGLPRDSQFTVGVKAVVVKEMKEIVVDNGIAAWSSRTRLSSST